MSDRLKTLAEAGVSIWLDDLSRERIETGNLADLVKEKSVVGVTTNPTIFQKAISGSDVIDRPGIGRILLGDPGVEHDLQQHVTEFLAHG